MSIWILHVRCHLRRPVSGALVLVQPALSSACGEHLIVLSFLDPFEREPFDGFLLVGAFASDGFMTGDGAWFAGIPRETGNTFGIINGRGREMGAHQLGPRAGNVVVGDGSARAAVDVGQFAGATFDGGPADAARALAMKQDSAGSGIVGNVHEGMRLGVGPAGRERSQARSRVDRGETLLRACGRAIQPHACGSMERWTVDGSGMGLRENAGNRFRGAGCGNGRKPD